MLHPTVAPGEEAPPYSVEAPTPQPGAGAPYVPPLSAAASTDSFPAPNRRLTSDSASISDLGMSGLRLSDAGLGGGGASAVYPQQPPLGGIAEYHRQSYGSTTSGGVGPPEARRSLSRPPSQGSFDAGPPRRTSIPSNTISGSDDHHGSSSLYRGPSGRSGPPARYSNSAAASVYSLDSVNGGGGAPYGGYDPMATSAYGGDPRRTSGPDFGGAFGPSSSTSMLPPIPQAQPMGDFGGGGYPGSSNPYSMAASNDFLGQPPPQSAVGAEGYRPHTIGPSSGAGSYGGNPVYPSSMGGGPAAAGAGPSRVVRAVSSASSLSLSRQPTQHIGSAKAKRKAIDINKPPFTREFVDDYRARMKGDPDPEAQFAFAKYLIEAARIIGDEIGVRNPRDGRRYRDNLVAESLKLIKRLAAERDAYAEAQFFLANLYGTGQLGLQVDYEKSYQLYMQASKQNHAAATYRTAVCNELGAGTRKEPNRAVLFYRKAAALRDTAAMYKLSMILLHGMLLQPRNPREGVLWLRRAAGQADEENPHALHELAMLHENPSSLGPGQQLLARDENMAREFYIQAAQLGYTPSQYKLGTCYEYGTLGCTVDPKRSIAWLSRAAEKGDSEAELALSGWFLTGAEGVLKQDDSEAYLWARKAANKGLAKAEYAVGCESTLTVFHMWLISDCTSLHRLYGSRHWRQTGYRVGKAMVYACCW